MAFVGRRPRNKPGKQVKRAVKPAALDGGKVGRPKKSLMWAAERASRFSTWVGKFGTQQQAADFLDMKRSTLCDWMSAHGNKVPDRQQLTNLFEKGRINLNWYLVGSGEMSVDNIGVLASGEADLHARLKSRLVNDLGITDDEADAQLLDDTGSFFGAIVDAFALKVYSAKYEKARRRALNLNTSKS